MYQANLFVPCLVDLALPDIGFATLNLLRRLGVEVNIPDTPGCCGQPFLNEGRPKRARSLARGVISAVENGKPLVVPSGSCAEMIKFHYPTLFEDEPRMQAKALELAQRTFELSSFLVDELGIEGIGLDIQGKVAYRPSCRALRGLGVRSQPLALLSSSRGQGASELESAEACCGFGGAFSFHLPEVSKAMAHARLEPFLQSGAEVLVVIEPGCMTHLSRALGKHETKQVRHIASVLYEALERRARP